jgi:hypothetical protein
MAIAHVSTAMTYSGVPIRKTWVHTNQTIGWLTRLAKTTIAAARGQVRLRAAQQEDCDRYLDGERQDERGEPVAGREEHEVATPSATDLSAER